jgi:hypothetical protein
MYLTLSKYKNTEDVSSISRAACQKSGKDRERSGDGEINGDRMRILGISVDTAARMLLRQRSVTSDSPRMEEISDISVYHIFVSLGWWFGIRGHLCEASHDLGDFWMFQDHD